VRFQLERADHRAAVVCDDVSDLELNGFRADGPEASPLLRLHDTRQAFIAGSRRVGTAGPFVELEGRSCRGVVIDGEDVCSGKGQ
jgi:hypothetical protein